MNNTMRLVMIGVLCLVLIYFIYRMIQEWPHEEVNEENRDTISEFRTAFLQHYTYIIGKTLHIAPENLKIDTDAVDWYNHMFLIEHNDIKIRTYVDWRYNKVKVVFSARYAGTYKTWTKRYLLKHNTINFEGFEKWTHKVYNKALHIVLPIEKDRLGECYAAMVKLAEDKTLTTEQMKRILFDAWLSLSLNMKNLDEAMKIFTSIGSYILRECPETWQKYLDDMKKEMGETSE